MTAPDTTSGQREGAASGRLLDPSRTLVALQPGYLPWLGFFDQVARSDVFVYLDHVQFDRRGWRNRNRIKGENAQPYWLTVPVRSDGVQQIREVEIDNGRPWARKHIGAIRQCYRRAPYLSRYLPELEELLTRRWESIAELDIALVDLICGWLGLRRVFVRSSTLGLGGRRTEMMLELCRHFGAGRYLSGDAANAYLDVALLREHAVETVWQQYEHPVYPQLHTGFVPYLSTLDLLLNCGEASAEIIRI